MERRLSYGFSSVGRALVSKTRCREFEPSNPCKIKIEMSKNIFKQSADYCKLCYDELVHNTTWPTSKELIHSAGVVLLASLVIAVIVFLMDVVFKNFMLLVYPN